MTLREKVARAMAAKDSGPEGSPLFDIHWREFSDGYLASTDAALSLIRNEVLEEAARLAEGFPARMHGNLSADTFKASEQTAKEIAAAIRNLKEKRT